MERPEQPDLPEGTPASGGQVSPHAQLMELVYDELRDLASRCLTRERPGHTLQPTALVHEAFLRIREISEIKWKNQAHFFAFAAQTLRACWLTTPGLARGPSGAAATHGLRWTDPPRPPAVVRPWICWT